ncbi:response regulator [Candidatus Uhrbacteria bacterium]|nr:response regulator [Candidatus Uhrbacteria bacterium]
MEKHKNDKLVLLVEDDPYIADTLARRLKREGVDTRITTDGLQVLKEIHRWRPQLVVADLILPHLTGFDILSMVQKDDDVRDTPVLLVSTLEQPGDREKAKSLGAVGYVVKSDHPLSELVRDIMRFVPIS